MFLSINKKNNVYPCKPKFYYIKVGFEGVEITCFRDGYKKDKQFRTSLQDQFKVVNLIFLSFRSFVCNYAFIMF